MLTIGIAVMLSLPMMALALNVIMPSDAAEGDYSKRKDHVISPSPALTPTPMQTSAITPTVPPTPPSSLTPSPIPSPTPTPPAPGFEAVFAIAGLLAVAYLVLRKKRQK